MDDETNARYYETDWYREFTHGQAEVDERKLAEQKIRAQHLVSWLRYEVGEVKTHLDVGSSLGVLIDEVRGRYHCASVGVEPSERFRAWASENTQGTYVAGLEGVQGPFDLISIIHTLEHMSHPRETLERLREMGKTILLEVPNRRAEVWAYSLGHPVAFDWPSLEGLLERTGWTVREAFWHGVPKGSPLDLNMTVLCE